jgi:hypothetical protein
MLEYHAGLGRERRSGLTSAAVSLGLTIRRIRIRIICLAGCAFQCDCNFSYNSLGRKRRLQ